MRTGACFALVRLALLGWTSAAASVTQPTPDDHWQSDTPQIFVDGVRLHYYGQLNDLGAARVRVALTDHPDLQALHIASPGGDGLASIDIGEQVHARGLAVVVVGEGCVSACANYVFTPARRRTISPESLVLWHFSCPAKLPDRSRHMARMLRRSFGTPAFVYTAQDEDGPINDPVKLRENFERNLDTLVQAQRTYVQSARNGHRRIFESIGVDPRVVCLTDHVRLPKVPERFIGFMYTLPVEDMARFGICDVEARPDYAEWAARTFAGDAELRQYAGVIRLSDHPRFRPRPASTCAAAVMPLAADAHVGARWIRDFGSTASPSGSAT